MWTDAQKNAIHSPDPDLLVSASAGSGKTSVMIERIARLLETKKVTPEGLLVLTFTNASASDMRIKLRKRLPQMTVELSGAQIGTFHQFCTDLIQTYFNIAGVDAGVGVLDDDAKIIIQDEILDRVIVENYDNATDAVDTFCATRKTDGLKKQIRDIYNFLGSLVDAGAWLDNVACASYRPLDNTNPAWVAVLDYYHRWGGYYKAQLEQFMSIAQKEQNEKFVGFVSTCIKAAEKLLGVKKYNDLYQFSFEWEAQMRNNDFSRFKELQSLRNQIKKTIKKITEDFDTPEADVIKNGQRDHNIVSQIVLLVRKFTDAFDAEKKRLERIDFGDMERLAIKILDDKEVIKRLQEKYKYIFVDEFQDTNPVQAHILRKLTGQNQNSFSVGDVKQSIYGFRGSDVSIIKNKMKTLEPILLNANFRSHPDILDFANRVFERVMTPRVGIDYKKDGMFVAGKDVGEATCLPSVETILVDTGVEREKPPHPAEPYDLLGDDAKSSDTQKIVAQSVAVAHKINQFVKSGFSFSDITILARSKGHMNTLSQVLSLSQIPSVTVDKQPAHQMFEVALLENFLFAATNHKNTVARSLCMMSMPFDFTPDEMLNPPDEKTKHFNEVMVRYNEIAKKHTVAQTLDMFIAEFHIIERLLGFPNGDVMVENIYRFLNKIRYANHSVGVARYLYLRENGLLEIQLEGGGGTNHVQIMTVHRSKGLEFPVTILFDISAGFSNVESRQFMVINPTLGLCIQSADITSYSKATNSIARMGAVLANKQTQVAEEIRLCYVALTRAQHHLVLVGATNVAKMEGKIQPNSYLDVVFHALDNPTIIPINTIQSDFATPVVRNFDGVETNKKLIDDLRGTFELSEQPVVGSDVVFKHSVTSLTKMEEETTDHTPQKMFVSQPDDRGGIGGMEYGTQFHNTMQFIDWESGVCEDKNINKCLEILRPLVVGMKLHREVPLLQNITIGGAEVLVQGVIDLLAIGGDRVIMVDYKTTRVSEDKLLELYKRQMELYAGAIKQSLGVEVVEVFIYSTHLGKLVVV